MSDTLAVVVHRDEDSLTAWAVVRSQSESKYVGFAERHIWPSWQEVIPMGLSSWDVHVMSNTVSKKPVDPADQEHVDSVLKARAQRDEALVSCDSCGSEIMDEHKRWDMDLSLTANQGTRTGSTKSFKRTLCRGCSKRLGELLQLRRG